MLIIGCDYHPSVQQIALADTETGECQERRLTHCAEAELYSNRAGAATCTWWSAPAALSYVLYATYPGDPWSGMQVLGPPGSQYNTNANLCQNTVSLSGLSAGTYNIAFGGTDAAGNTAQSDNRGC